MELTQQQASIVWSLYFCAIVPILVMLALYFANRLPRWVVAVHFYSFLICAFGWEIWYTYGLVGGMPVDARRAPALSAAIPQDINWVLTSLFDASIVCLVGLLLVWVAYGLKNIAFKEWRWPAFCILFVYFVAQNVYVEIMLHEQVKPGMTLSWAPLIPTGPWWNFVLFDIDGRTVTFQTQLPWVLMVPIFYWLVIYCFRRFSGERTR